MSSAKVKTGQLWGKSKDDLMKQLDELKTELGQLRVQKIAGGSSSKLTRMYDPTPSVFRYFHFEKQILSQGGRGGEITCGLDEEMVSYSETARNCDSDSRTIG
ncbi:60S ribosomal protein L35, L29 [Microsporum audouinii]